MIKKIILPIILAVTTMTAQASEYATKIAVIDIHHILEKSIAVQNVKKDIEKISENLRQEMSKKEEELQKDEQEIKNKHDSLSEDALNQEIKNFNKKVSGTQRTMQERKNKLEQAHAEAINKIQEATMKIVYEISKEKGFNLALPSAHIFYAAPELNITEEVITRLNVQLKSVHVNYK